MMKEPTNNYRLYHFCSERMVESILKNGLTLGKCPIMYPIGMKFISKCQWLTSEGDPSKQSWATAHLIRYSRTDFRVTIEIPRIQKKKLFKARDFIAHYPLESRAIVTEWEGHEHWYIFKGAIPPEWIVECLEM